MGDVFAFLAAARFTGLLCPRCFLPPALLALYFFGAARGPSAGAGAGDGVRWVSVSPCVVLHTVNAHEEVDPLTGLGSGKVRLQALRSIPGGPQSFICEYTPAFLYEWVLDFERGVLLAEG